MTSDIWRDFLDSLPTLISVVICGRSPTWTFQTQRSRENALWTFQTQRSRENALRIEEQKYVFTV